MRRRKSSHTVSYWQQRIRFSVQFTLRVQRGSDMGSLVACVSHAGQRLRYSLGLSHIPVRYWDEVRQRMFPRSPRAEEVNKEIDRNMEVILFYFTAAAGDTNEPPSLDGLQTRLFPNHHNISTHSNARTRFARPKPKLKSSRQRHGANPNPLSSENARRQISPCSAPRLRPMR